MSAKKGDFPAKIMSNKHTSARHLKPQFGDDQSLC